MTSENRLVGYYKKRNTPEGVDITLSEFFEGVRSGEEWQRWTEWVREAVDDKEEYDRRKSLSACVTLGGTFNGEKKAENLREPSGLLAADLDHLDDRTEAIQFQLKQDPYVLAVFKSIGGRGLCVVFKIDSSRFADSFAGIAEYLMTTYGLVGKQFDPSSSNVNRLRYISHDPTIEPNWKAKLFLKFLPKKPKNEPKKTGFVDTDRDIQYIIDQINARAIDITGGYQEWYKIGWSLISKYGEAARDIFQQVSQYADSYDPDECDKKFKYLTDTRPHTITISTFFYHCKQAGIEIMSPVTKEVVGLAQASKRNGTNLKSAIEKVVSMGGIEEKIARPIIEQVFASNVAFDTEETLFDQIGSFIKTNYKIRYNLRKRDFEHEDGIPLEDHHYYAIYINVRRALGEKVRYEDVYKIIHSRTICDLFDPFHAFFNRYKGNKPIGAIQALADTIDSDTGFGDGEFEPTYVYTFLRKWLVGLIGSIYGTPCDLVPVFTGADGIGKTWFFRLLLPDEWKDYFIDSKWIPGKDEDVEMCKNIIAFNDEFKGRDTKDMEHFKALTSKEFFIIREPYTRKSVKMQRLAMLCATSNHKGVINEPEYNRRIIPINVLSINHAAYNAIDKVDLIMEAYHAYQAGERYTLTKAERALLGSQTEEFQNKSIERQLIEQYLQVPTDNGGEQVQFMSTIDILAKLEIKLNNRKLDDRKVGRELTACGFVRKQKRTTHGKREWGYEVLMLD